MFGRKPKRPQQPSQGRDRSARAERTNASTFSYYANRQPDVPPAERRNGDRTVQAATKPVRRGKRRLSATRLSYWLLAGLIVICITKLLYLSTDPKLVVLGKSSVTSTYLQPTDTYTRFTHDQLTGSITNHIKPTTDVNGTTTALERRFPELQSVSLGVPLFSSRPIVYVEVAQPSVIVRAGQDNYALNRSGLVLAKLTSLPAGIPALVDESGASPEVGKQLLPGSIISFITTVNTQLKAGKLMPDTYVLPRASPYELDVRLQGSAYVLKFDLQGEALRQSGAALATIERLTPKLPASYIDIRVPGRVYYK